MPRRHDLLVSIHDVTPAFASEVQQLWSICRAHELTPALLVVPDWHGAWPLEAHPEYVGWLQACVAEGADVILHGERHDEQALPRGMCDAVRAFGRTAREGEFLTLDYSAARERIDRGVRRLQALDLSPSGFIPPAWLARQATHDAVRDAGLTFSEDAAGVRLHRSGVRMRVPALRWSGRTRSRALASALVARGRWHLHRNAPLVRIALHPMDLANDVTAKSVERELARWSRHGRQVRYESLA